MSEPMPTSAPPVPGDSLFTLLREHCPSEVDRTWGLLAPYYAMVEQGGSYPLQPAGELDRLAIATAIQTAFQLPELPKVVCFSLVQPFPKPDWMSEEVHRNSLGNSLRSSPWSNLGTNLRSSLGDSLRSSLWASLHISLGNNLRDSLRSSLGDSLWNSLRNSLRDYLFYYLGLLLAGEIEQAERLSGLIRVQIGCLIVGVKKDEPNTWMVVCQ